MVTTLLRIKEHRSTPRIVVWAHNSHVGDSTATGRGGADFKRNEQWNLGQMTRTTFPEESCIVAFYTHSGSVMAADSWGHPGGVKELNPALEGSYEDIFLQIGERFFFTTKSMRTEGRPAAYHPPALPCKLRLTHEGAHISAAKEMRSKRVKLAGATFTAVARTELAGGVLRLRTDRGAWVTEFTPHAKVSPLPHLPRATTDAHACRSLCTSSRWTIRAPAVRGRRMRRSSCARRSAGRGCSVGWASAISGRRRLQVTTANSTS